MKNTILKKDKEKIKVWMQYPWKYNDSSYYKYLLNYPPKNIEFLNIKANSGVIIDKENFIRFHKLKQIIKAIIKKTWPSMPNAHLTKTIQKYDLIHCAHCISLNKKKPWIADIEYIGQLWAGAPGYFDKRPSNVFIKKILKRKNCKKILAWTKNTKEEIEKNFPEIKNKIKLLYPAIPEQKKLKKIKKKITLLFISRRFYFKGGLYALKVMDKITKEYKNTNCIVISDTPKEILKVYSKNKRIKFLELMPQEKIFKEIYPKADIFIYPAWTDTFGFGFIEALSFGLPVIGIKGHCNEEIIEENKNGFLVGQKEEMKSEDLESTKNKEHIIQALYEKTELLIKNSKLRENMSKNALKEIKNGKFSIRKRNEKLNEIYNLTLNR